MRSTVNAVIEGFNRLSIDEKVYVLEVMEKQLIEAKREAIIKRAREAMDNFRKGAVKIGGVKELFEDLEGDEDNLG